MNIAEARPFLSRDRKGAGFASNIIRREDGHWLPLLLDDIVKSLPHILVLPQPTRASMPGPASAIGFVAPQLVQIAAGVRFELIDNSLGLSLGFHDYMHMIRPYVRSQQVPAAMRTVLLNRRKHCCPASLIQNIWILKHCAAFASGEFLIPLD